VDLGAICNVVVTTAWRRTTSCATLTGSDFGELQQAI
jgi:hypothetical protein